MQIEYVALRSWNTRAHILWDKTLESISTCHGSVGFRLLRCSVGFRWVPLLDSVVPLIMFFLWVPWFLRFLLVPPLRWASMGFAVPLVPLVPSVPLVPLVSAVPLGSDGFVGFPLFC